VVSRGKAEQQAARNARLAAALRENLKRRKAQARGRSESDTADADLTEARKEASKVPDFRRNRSRD